MRYVWMLLLLTVALSGCQGLTALTPFRYQPTEAQRSAADLVVQDVTALKGHVTPAAEPVRAEAEVAAKVTQTYMGLPKVRPNPVAPENTAIIDEAEVAATQPQPTIVDTVLTSVDTAFDLADALMVLVAGAAGTAGFLKVRSKVLDGRAKLADVSVQKDALAKALRDLVTGVEDLKHKQENPKEVTQVIGSHQDADTRAVIDGVRAGL